MRHLLVVTSLLVAVALPARAQSATRTPSVPGAHLAAETVVKRLASADLRALLEEAGFAIESVQGDTLVIGRDDDLRLAVNLTNDGQLVHVWVAFTGTKATLEFVNDWNRESLLSRAYLDEDGDPTIETELDIEGGVTGARIRDYLRTTRKIVGEFASKLPY